MTMIGGPPQFPPHFVAYAIGGVRGAVNVTRNLPEIEHRLIERVHHTLNHFAETIEAIESLIPILEREAETTSSLVSPLKANEAATETMVQELVTVRKGIDTMQPDIADMRKAMESLNDNLAEIRAVAEPLRSATLRIGRFSDRHARRLRD